MSQTASNLVSAREQASSINQVFINHRGVDVKKTLASLIYWRLTEVYGYSVFLDEEELRVGDTSPLVIQGTIESSSVYICIFSRRYCESEWCLNELCWILRSWHDRHTKIIPVFYDVEPSDLQRIESGPFARAFEDHRLQGRDRDIVEWRAALNEASQICGFVFKTSESDHGDILERIVKDVITEIIKQEPEIVKREPLEVSPHPVVGIEQAVEDLQSTIEQFDLHETVLVVGIVGVEGVGKSTLAKHFYNLKRLDFSRSCFLSEVSKSKDNLSSLQHKLPRDLLGYCDMHLDDCRQGRSILRDRLRGLPVLIVLDDVDEVEQMDSLLDIDAVGRGSLIVITSRDKHLLRCSYRKIKTVLYEIKPLEEKYARELFCQHAFLQPKPYKGFEDLVNEFLKICGGLPLLLNILGAQLLGMPDRMCWKLLFEKLSSGLPDNILNILKVSYEDLNGEEKEMFLKIGCFFVGEERDLVVRVLEGMGYNEVWDCLESLRQRCLVEYHDDVPYLPEVEFPREEHICNCEDLYRRPLKGRYKITMHDQVKELARHIATEDFRGLGTRKPPCFSFSNDMQKILHMQLKTFAPHEMLSTAIFSGMAYEKETLDDRDLISIMMQKFKLGVVDLVSDTTSFSSLVHIENFHSHGAILMCFISSPVSSRPFHVKFDADNSGGPAQEYGICRGNGRGKSLDVFLWRADSNLFTGYKEYNAIDVYCSELLGSAVDAEHVERGWMMLVDKNTNVVEVCKEFLNVFTSKNCGEKMYADGQHSWVGAGEKASRAY